MPNTAISYRAGWSRVAMAIAGVTLLPLVFGPLSAYAWVFVGYGVVALAIQFAIKKDLGGNLRVIVGGIVDVAVLSLFVHRLGSTANVLPALYVFIAVMNTLAVGRRAAMPVAVIAVVAYCGIQVAEQIGVIPYAPDPPTWTRPAMPTVGGAIGLSVLVGGLVLTATYSVGTLVDMVRLHERELELANARLEELSQRDPLTQLFNRRHLVHQLERELERVRRGHDMALLMIDLDRFKRVNDERGHLAGDAVLREIAAALEKVTRATDVAARYGGDEFMVVLTDMDIEHAQSVADRLLGAVRDAAESAAPEAGVTASVGITVARADDDVGSLLSRADENTYSAKQAGGDRYVSTKLPIAGEG